MAIISFYFANAKSKKDTDHNGTNIKASIDKNNNN